MRVLSSLVCLLLLALLAAGSVVHKTKSTHSLNHSSASTLHSASKVTLRAAHTSSHKTAPVAGDENSFGKALFDDLSAQKHHAAQHKNIASSRVKHVHRDLEKEAEAQKVVVASGELDKVLAAEGDLEAITDKLSALKSELRGIESALRGEPTKVAAAVVPAVVPVPVAQQPAVTIESSAAEAVAAETTVSSDAAEQDAPAETSNVDNNVEESAALDAIVTSSSSDADENAASLEEGANNSESVPASPADETAVAEQSASSDDDVAMIQISDDVHGESLVEQLTRTRMNINKRVAAMHLAETEKPVTSDKDDESLTLMSRNGKMHPINETYTVSSESGVVTVDNGTQTDDKDVVCVCKRNGAPRGDDRVRCKKHTTPTPKPTPSIPSPPPPVGIRQCATGRWPNGTEIEGGTLDTICIYFPAKLNIPAPTPIPIPPTNPDEPEYPPECFDERNEFVAAGVEKHPFDVLLLQQGFETCGC